MSIIVQVDSRENKNCEVINYFEWGIYAMIISLITIFVIIVFNMIFNKKEAMEIIKKIKNIIRGRKAENG